MGLDNLLEQLLAQAGPLTGADTAQLFLLDPRTRQLYPRPAVQCGPGRVADSAPAPGAELQSGPGWLSLPLSAPAGLTAVLQLCREDGAEFCAEGVAGAEQVAGWTGLALHQDRLVARLHCARAGLAVTEEVTAYHNQADPGLTAVLLEEGLPRPARHLNLAR